MNIVQTVVRVFLVGCALAAGWVQAGTVTYYHNDPAGSPVVATNAAGQVIWRESYRPYGERLTNAPASSTNDIWFTSRRQDADTGLVYMGARYYDPVIGRFMSIDPVGFDEKNIHSFNRYAYANNNPYKYVDPDGKWATLAIGGIRFAPAALRALATVGSGLGIVIYNATHSEPNSSDGARDQKGQDGGDREGCVYCVKGDKTSSGKDYVGSTDNLDQRKKDTSDGRDREGAEVIDSYPKGDREERRTKEQRAINDRGGVENLDNRRNEIAPKKWPDYGIDPPK
jgi:RHS repeat-associated protein